MNDLALGRAVVTYTVMHRPAKRRGDEFPLTGGWVQCVTRRLGHRIGEHRALKIITLLIEQGVIVSAGSYGQDYDPLQPSGFRVRLFKLRSGPLVQASVRRRRVVKPWWRHPLFGMGCESYPKSLPKRLRKWKEPPEWAG